MEGIRTEKVSFGKRTAKRFDSVSLFFNEIGSSMAGFVIEVLKFIGIWALCLADIFFGGVTLSWVVSKVTPSEFVLYGKIFSWLLSGIIFVVISALWSNWEDVSNRKNESKFDQFVALVFPITLNLLDSIVDACIVFVVFDQGEMLLGGSLKLSNISVFEWIVMAIVFLISFFAEKWRVTYSKSRSREYEEAKNNGFTMMN